MDRKQKGDGANSRKDSEKKIFSQTDDSEEVVVRSEDDLMSPHFFLQGIRVNAVTYTIVFNALSFLTGFFCLVTLGNKADSTHQ